MRVVERELVAQDVKERRLGCHLDGLRLPIELEGDALCHLRSPLSTSNPGLGEYPPEATREAKTWWRSLRFPGASLIGPQTAKSGPCSGEILPCSARIISLLGKLGNLRRKSLISKKGVRPYSV